MDLQYRKNCSIIHRHNLAIPNEMDYILSQLGGTDKLKRTYPEVYKMLMRSGERARNIANGALVAPIVHNSETGDILGKVDSIGIRMLNFDISSNTCTLSGMSMVAENKSMVIIGDLRDVTHDRSLDGFAVTASNAHDLNGFSDVPSSQLITDTEYEFLASSTFYKTMIDENGESYYVTETQKTDAVKMLKATALVESVTVQDPMPIEHPNASKTVIFYNNRTGSDCDYYYNNVSTGEYDTEVNIDFSGSVTFIDGFKPMYVDKNKDFKLQLINKGAAAFNSAYWNDIKWDVNGNTLSWTFPTNWHNRLSSSQFHAADSVEFYCKMYIMTQSNILVPIVISSSAIEHKDPSYKQIKPIEIQWGCFAKGTKITMSNGTAKPVETIQKGDIVRTMNGTAKVTSIVKGEESRMIVISTAHGNRLILTKDHPVLTENGWKTASELSAADRLLTSSGTDRISELHFCNYHGTVYSFSIDSDDAILAECIYAGDFRCQNKEKQSKIPEKKEGYQEEMEALIQELDRSLKRR